MPRGNVRLFRDDFFNNHPILLEYLVEDTHDGSPLNGVGVVDQTRAKFQDHDNGGMEQFDTDQSAGSASSVPTSAGFVDKMRTANPLRGAGGLNDTADGSETGENANTALERPTTAMSSSGHGVQTSHFSIDPSDPKSTTRKLLKHIEILMVRCSFMCRYNCRLFLCEVAHFARFSHCFVWTSRRLRWQETIASQKNRQMDACNDALMEENKRLQIENNNIPILQEQIRELKKELAAVVGRGARSSVVDVKRSKELEVRVCGEQGGTGGAAAERLC